MTARKFGGLIASNYSGGVKSHKDGRIFEANRMEPCDWRIQVFFDGACPLCRREIAMIKRWDRKGQIWFTDISKSDFNSKEWGFDQKTLMDQMHARLSDGTWVRGVEAFRQIYAMVGFAWIIPVTRLPGISQAIDWAYRLFARNRLRWTGRCEINETCRRNPHQSANP